MACNAEDDDDDDDEDEVAAPKPSARSGAGEGKRSTIVSAKVWQSLHCFAHPLIV